MYSRLHKCGPKKWAAQCGLALPLCATLFLGSCLGGILPFGEETSYEISGAGDDAALEAYLQTILKNRLTQKLEPDDDPDIMERRVAYRESMILADLKKAMAAKGYYDGAVDFADDPAGPMNSPMNGPMNSPMSSPMSGQYHVMPGAQYTIQRRIVEPAEYAALLGDADVQEGDPLDAEAALRTQKNLYDAVSKDRCYFSLDVKNAVVLDKVNHAATLTYHVAAGAQGNFGPVIFTGQTSVKDSYLAKLIPWKEGDCFRRERIEILKAKLLESGLFVRAEAVLPAGPDENGLVSLEIQVTERAHRTLRAGLSYYTDEGIGAVFGWEHRNFLGAAEKLSATLNLSTLKRSLDLALTKPFFLRKDQSLSFNTALRRQETDAYDELGADIGVTLSRNFHKRLNGSIGANLTVTQISEENNLNNDEKLYGLLSVPAALTFDNRNDKLDPMRGWLVTASVSPFVDILGESDPFVKMQILASTYASLDDDGRSVVALRAGLGGIVGGETFNVPPTERFYAGGGGTVRGYGYQEVGPKDFAGDPLGGRSIVTASVEFRQKMTDTIGAVAFVDAGSVSEDTYPDMGNMAIGAGVGVRYYTGFGPLRFDVAVPLTQKEKLDQNFQFYISIGQAF